MQVFWIAIIGVAFVAFAAFYCWQDTPTVRPDGTIASPLSSFSDDDVRHAAP